MNRSLSALATRRAADGIGPQQESMCQMWVRLTVQALYGSQWDRWLWRNVNGKGSASISGRAFRQGYEAGELPDDATVILSSRVQDTQLGDILYRVTDGFGHVSIRVEGNRVAENSTVHSGPHGAVGFRPLSAVSFNTIVRLPDPAIERAAPTPLELLGECYAEAAGDTEMVGALNRFRWHPDVAGWLE